MPVAVAPATVGQPARQPARRLPRNAARPGWCPLRVPKGRRCSPSSAAACASLGCCCCRSPLLTAAATARPPGWWLRSAPVSRARPPRAYWQLPHRVQSSPTNPRSCFGNLPNPPPSAKAAAPCMSAPRPPWVLWKCSRRRPRRCLSSRSLGRTTRNSWIWAPGSSGKWKMAKGRPRLVARRRRLAIAARILLRDNVRFSLVWKACPARALSTFLKQRSPLGFLGLLPKGPPQ